MGTINKSKDLDFEESLKQVGINFNQFMDFQKQYSELSNIERERLRLKYNTYDNIIDSVTDKKSFQILNYRFRKLNNSSIEITLPNGACNTIFEKQAYEIYNDLYIKKNADKIYEEAIHNLNIKVGEEIKSKTKLKELERELKKLFQSSGIKSVYKSVTTNKYNVVLSGNLERIVYTYVFGLHTKNK